MMRPASALGAGLPTPPSRPTEGLQRPTGDLRSSLVRGQETRAELRHISQCPRQKSPQFSLLVINGNASFISSFSFDFHRWHDTIPRARNNQTAGFAPRFFGDWYNS